jgi:hypothetical protein
MVRSVNGRGFVRHRASAVLVPLLAAALWASLSAQAPRQFYAAPTGSPSNDGSLTRPLDLATALSASSPLRAGDTLWLRGGVYRRPASPDSQGDPAVFASTLTGTAAAPIVVRQYPGERATLDGNLAPSTRVLVVHGSYTWYWGFEITNSDPNRYVTRGDGLDSYGHHNRFINLIIHDTGQGVGFWATSQADDSEVYGSVISHVGHEASDRGHGHSFYVQNVNGNKRIVDNILFDGFSFGVHAYTSNGRIDNIEVRGNIAFNHGRLSVTGGDKANILFAGDQIGQNPTVVDNYGYYPFGSDGRNLDVSGCNNGRFQNNYLAGGTPLRLSSCTNTVVSGNTLYGPVASSTQVAYPSNTYGTTPSGVFVGIRPNAYETGRANIAVFNWALSPTVQVNLSGANLPVGTRFEVRDAQNFFAAPVVTGTYTGGPITLPMTGLTAAPPIGNAPIVPPHTAPQFGAFVVLPLAPVTPPPPPPPAAPRIDTVSPPAGSAAGGLAVTLTGSGFAPGASVQVGGVAATAVVVPNGSTVSFIAPPHAPGSVDIVVASAGQQATRPAAFRYDPVAPALNPATVSGSLVSLRWQAGTSTPVRGYAIVAGRAPGVNEFGPFALGPATTLAAAVAPGTYYARVLADTNWGLLASNEVGFTVGAAVLPSPPTLAPAAQNGRVVSLSWSGATGATSYVLVARLSSAGAPVATLPVAGTTLTVNAPPGQYFVTVVGVNGQGIGPESNQIVVTVP